MRRLLRLAAALSVASAALAAPTMMQSPLRAIGRGAAIEQAPADAPLIAALEQR